MPYKLHAMGYFGPVAKVSRGPWWREYWVEDDGLDWFYQFQDNDGNANYLLSNNLPYQDREKLDHLHSAMVRNNRLGWFGGLWLGFETIRKVPYFRSMALGWQGLTWLGLGYFYRSAFMTYTSQSYNPTISAYLRKYQNFVKKDLFDIRDEKKQYFYIDTSQYMSDRNMNIGDEYHAHEGPQPVSQRYA